MNIWVSLLPALAVAVFTMFVLSIRGHGRSTFRSELGTVELSVPKGRVTTYRVTAACIPVLALLAGLARPTQPDLPGAFLLGGVCLAVCGTLLLAASVMARAIVVSREGVSVVGFRGWHRSWAELASITAVSPTGRDSLLLRFEDGSKVAADSSFNGWSDLMKQLSALTQHDEAAHDKVVNAIRELNRWKPAAERY